MMPFSSVAMIEKLALVRIAFCRAPVLRSAFWRRASLPSALASSVRLGTVSGMGIERIEEIPDYHDSASEGRCANPHSEGSDLAHKKAAPEGRELQQDGLKKLDYARGSPCALTVIVGPGA